MDPKLVEALKTQTEARTKLNGLPDDTDEATVSEARTALDNADAAVIEALDNETEERGAPEELTDKIQLGRYLTSVVEERQLDGAEAEMNKEIGIEDSKIPFEAMLPLPEERADSVSPVGSDGNALPSGGVNKTTANLLSRVFDRTDAAALGVTMPIVPSGERGYPVMTDGTTAAMSARGQGPDAGAAKFTVVNATPHRQTARYVFDLEGVAELGGLLESTLRADLRNSMGDLLDSQIIAGSGAGANVSGILKQIAQTQYGGGTAAAPSQLTWETIRAIATSLVDAKFAPTEANISLAIGRSTYQRARNVYRDGATASNQDAIEALQALGTTVRQSFRIPAETAITTGSAHKQEQLIWSAEPGAAVAPVWQGITLIRDPYTNAKNAQVILTGHMLFDFIVRRKDGWKNLVVNPLNTAK